MSAQKVVHDPMDEILTLRGHRITLRQALAEGILSPRKVGSVRAARPTQMNGKYVYDRSNETSVSA